MRAELVALCLQFFAQFLKIVDFAVEREREALVLGEHRLRAAAQIDDRQSAMAKTDPRRSPNARSVWAAMRQGVGHPPDAFGVDRLGAFDMEDTGNAAHDAAP
jgi:hypothetical protein